MSSSTADRQWFIVGRFEEFEGEGRANLLRLVGIAAFYSVELINYHGLIDEPRAGQTFHFAVSLLTLAWAALGLVILLCRRNGIFPTWLKYASTGADLVLLTSVLVLGEGPRASLAVVYLLIIATAGLRFSLPLVWFATGGALVGYLFLLGFARWGKMPEGWPTTTAEMQVLPYAQITFLLALGLCGVVVGQIVRRVRAMAELYTNRRGGAA